MPCRLAGGGRLVYFHYPYHVSVFTERSLRLSVCQAGLRPLSVRRVRHPTSGLRRNIRRAAACLGALTRPSGGCERHVPIGVNIPTATRLLVRPTISYCSP